MSMVTNQDSQKVAFQGQEEMGKVVKTGNLMSRSFVPQAPGNTAASCLGVLLAVMLVTGIILWSIGAAQGNADLALAGQILFGKSLGIAFVLGCIAACGAARSSSSARSVD